MQGRIKRKLAAEARDRQAAHVAALEDANSPLCALCERPLGTHIEWHHRIPKSEGGEQTVPVHPICHRTIHAHVSNHELAGPYADLDVLRAREDIQRFLRWIARRPPDFHAPTRRKQPA